MTMRYINILFIYLLTPRTTSPTQHVRRSGFSHCQSVRL